MSAALLVVLVVVLVVLVVAAHISCGCLVWRRLLQQDSNSFMVSKLVGLVVLCGACECECEAALSSNTYKL